MINRSLSFAKIVSTPSSLSWSQAYNAGSLFVVISLENQETDSEENLPGLGKTLLNNIETEFFPLEEKTLKSIKEALETSITDVPSSVHLSLCVAFVKEAIVYLYSQGGGVVTLKREGETGVILTTHKHAPLISASGFLQNGDTLLLQTHQFSAQIKPTMLATALEGTLPSDIAEMLSPHIHGSDAGAAAAIIMRFSGASHVEGDDDTLGAVAAAESVQEEDQRDAEPVHQTAAPQPQRKKLPFALSTLPLVKLSIRRKIALLLILVILGVLLGSILFTKKTQLGVQNEARFTQIYDSAKKSFDEGEGLRTLNAALARDDYVKAQKTLADAKGEFPTGSKEAQQLSSLQEKVTARLGVGGTTTATPVTLNDTALLSVEKTTPASAYTVDDTYVYAVTSSGVTAMDKGNKKTQTIIKNTGDWKNAVGLGVFNGNVYVLDPSTGVLKYPGPSYTKSDYFSSTSPELSTAVSMAIDGSLWILKNDGTVLKFTKGKPDAFTPSELPTSFSHTTKIYTSADISTVYVLDTGNGQIVAMDKTGTFKHAYTTAMLKTAIDFTVSEKNKTISVLQDKKTWTLPL